MSGRNGPERPHRTGVVTLPGSPPEAHVNAAGYVQFDVDPDKHPAAGTAAAAKILGRLEKVDHAAHTNLGRLDPLLERQGWRLRHRADRRWHRTPEYEGVAGLLVRAGELLREGFTAAAGAQVDEAATTYRKYVDGRTRRNYLVWAVVGAAVALALLVALQASGWIDGLIPRDLGYQIGIFATIGALTSIMTRINDLDLTSQVTRVSIWISGGVRPFVAIGVALVAYVMIDSGLVSIAPQTLDPDRLAVIVAFLCGFSERFANEFLDRGGALVPHGPDTTAGDGGAQPRAE